MELKIDGILENVLKKIDVEEEKTVLTRSFKDISQATSPKKKVAKIYSFDHPIEIIPLFDPHIGLKSCNKQKLKDTIAYILAAPNRYTVLGGDILECATKTSVGMAMYEEDMPPKDQLFFAYNLLKPLADAGKILDSLTGNHEMRLANFADMNPMEILARQLNIPYSEYQGFVVIKINDNVYKIALYHGASTATTATGAIMSMRKQTDVVDADLYLSGHIHVKAEGSDPYYKINEETGDLELRSRKYVVCGSFVEYWGSYAEMKALQPAETGTAKIMLSSDRWSIETYIPRI